LRAVGGLGIRVGGDGSNFVFGFGARAEESGAIGIVVSNVAFLAKAKLLHCETGGGKKRLEMLLVTRARQISGVRRKADSG
jgi:hypothetical protein